jgi:dihydrodipicolinate synthase/N-acetylneuraminate lyase
MNMSEESKEKYQGIFVAAPVPMKEDYSVDLPKIGKCVECLIDAGMKSGNAVYAVCGAGGEHMHLTVEERRAVAEASVQFAAGRVPVFVGVSHPSTLVSVELARHAEEIGADGLQVEPPYYFQGTSDDVFEYFRAISESVSIGLTAYNTPWTSSFDMDRHFLDRLASLKNIIGLKWYSANLSEFVHVLQNYQDRFSIISNLVGGFLASVFILGAKGYVSQGANFAPRIHLQILKLLRQRKYEEATSLYLRSEGVYYDAARELVRQGINGEGNFIKACMPLIGVPCGPARPPHRTPPAWFPERVRAALESVGELDAAAELKR